MRRLISAIIILTLFLSGFLRPSLAWLSLSVVLALGVGSAWELAVMARRQGIWIQSWIARLGVLVIGVCAYLRGVEGAFLALGLSVCASLGWRVWQRSVPGAWRDVGGTLGALAYVGIPVACMGILFHGGDRARQWLILTLEVIWLTDTFAFFVGSSIGRHKLCPAISPGKTIEGSLGGFLGGGVLPLVLCRLGFLGNWEWLGAVEALGFCLVMSVVTQVGDLAESLLKRDFGVKDSGSSLTGHGGCMDMVDAVLFSMSPLVTYLYVVHPDVLHGA